MVFNASPLGDSESVFPPSDSPQGNNDLPRPFERFKHFLNLLSEGWRESSVRGALDFVLHGAVVVLNEIKISAAKRVMDAVPLEDSKQGQIQRLPLGRFRVAHGIQG